MKLLPIVCQILTVLVIIHSDKAIALSNSSNINKELADSINEFALKLYSRSTNKTQNYFISPFSVWMALGMCYAGAKGNTKSELKQVLAYGNNSDTVIFKQVERYLNNIVNTNNSKYVLNSATQMFPKKDKFSLNKSYIDLVKKYFKAGIQPLDFKNKTEAVKVVNDWVSNKTANKINNILSPDLINEDTRIILANALYFKAFWLFKFNDEKTTKQDFFLANGKKAKVDMMKIERKRYRCLTNLTDLDATTCELPYEGEHIAMTIILPNKNSSLSKLEHKLDINKLRYILNSQTSLVHANIYLPKFKLEYKAEMSNDLIALGAKSAFTNKSDLSGLSPNESLRISKVVHQTVLDVNEYGTEAAAATVITIEATSLVLNPHKFVCDRPFMFFIHDTISKVILFIGKFTSP